MFVKAGYSYQAIRQVTLKYFSKEGKQTLSLQWAKGTFQESDADHTWTLLLASSNNNEKNTQKHMAMSLLKKIEIESALPHVLS